MLFHNQFLTYNIPTTITRAVRLCVRLSVRLFRLHRPHRRRYCDETFAGCLGGMLVSTLEGLKGGDGAGLGWAGCLWQLPFPFGQKF